MYVCMSPVSLGRSAVARVWGIYWWKCIDSVLSWCTSGIRRAILDVRLCCRSWGLRLKMNITHRPNNCPELPSAVMAGAGMLFFAWPLIATALLPVWTEASVASDWTRDLVPPTPTHRVSVTSVFESPSEYTEFMAVPLNKHIFVTPRHVQLNLRGAILYALSLASFPANVRNLIDIAGADAVNAALLDLSAYERNAFAAFALKTNSVEHITRQLPCIADNIIFDIFAGKLKNVQLAYHNIEALLNFFEISKTSDNTEHTLDTISKLTFSKFEQLMDYAVDHNLACAATLFQLATAYHKHGCEGDPLNAAVSQKLWEMLAVNDFKLTQLKLGLVSMAFNGLHSFTLKHGYIVDLFFLEQYHLAAYLLCHWDGNKSQEYYVQKYCKHPKMIDAMTRMPASSLGQTGLLNHIRMLQMYFQGFNILQHVIAYVAKFQNILSLKELFEHLFRTGQHKMLGNPTIINRLDEPYNLLFSVFLILSEMPTSGKTEVYPHLDSTLQRTKHTFDPGSTTSFHYLTETQIQNVALEFKRYKSWRGSNLSIVTPQ